MSDLEYQRKAYAQAVFDGKVESDYGDFNPKDFLKETDASASNRTQPGLFSSATNDNFRTTQPVVSALNSSHARVRMRAIIILASLGNLRANDIIKVAQMKNDKGEYDYMAGRTYAPSRFCPSVKHCVELFLPVIVQKSPSGVMAMITAIAHSPDDQVRQVMNILTEGGVVAVAAALAVSEDIPIDSLIQSTTILKGKVPDIPQLLGIYLENPDQSRPAIVQFLASKSPEYLKQFLAAIFNHGEKATPWLLEGIQYQTSGHICLEIATKCGPISIPWLIKGLSSARKHTRLACAYALSRTAGDSREARSALHTAVEQESGWLSRRQMRRFSKQLGE